LVRNQSQRSKKDKGMMCCPILS